ncbi:LacI family DNA-binding transcriptional regulator [Ramlibacter rhizophilus]|uniref:LacI family transcriptional regulator n=1 Tax=Ramlibacter rhizophilus TaxID=1781167 RepID=A0A4Z0BL40_9BURK|nr:LacI family DNA-binding transcriptional regulator [Ramlibacter rhizophilus]TFY98628.1 LacI family transcriptional regulator [Ramlibacter rhizophilus]
MPSPSLARAGRPITVVDVARQAGVSLATVSRVINGSATVSALKREQVTQAMLALDFRPDPMAQGLRRGQGNAVALLVGDIAQRHFAELTQHVQRALEGQGYDLLLFNLGHQQQRLEQFLARALRMKLRGVVLATSDALTRPVFEAGRQLLAQGVAVVSLGQDLSREGIGSIVHEERSATRRSVERLLALGHRQVAYVGRVKGSAIGTERFLGYRDALQAAGTFDPVRVWDMSFRYTAGHESVMRALDEGISFTALQAGSDEIAMGAIAALEDRGLRVPQDVAVVGFGDIDLGAYLRPALSTLSSSPQLAATQLAELLRAAEAPAAGPVRIELPRELVERASSQGARKP